MARTKKPVVIVCNVNGLSTGYASKRRTVTSSMGGDYTVELPPGQPVALVGDDEIKAFSADLGAPTMKTLELTPEQADIVLHDLADKRSADEIAKLKSQVAWLQRQLDSPTNEPATVA